MTTEIRKIDGESLRLAASVIKGGGLVAFPTETVYGLGANAFDSDAVGSIFRAKGRPSDNPLIVHVHADYDIGGLVYDEFEYVKRLRAAFVPGPLTLVYRSRGAVSPLVSCGLDTLAVRVPSDKNAAMFLREVNLPIAAPSANASKHISPVTAQHVYEDMNGKIPLILDGGRCTGGIESTVLDVTTETPRILRSGLITCEMIESVAGRCEYAQHREGDKVRSPGVKYKHYSPKCPTKMYGRNELEAAVADYKSALKRGLSPIFVCDDFAAEELKGYRCIPIGKTSLQHASALYDALHRAESEANYIIGISLEGDSQIEVGVMNRFAKACAEDVK